MRTEHTRGKDPKGMGFMTASPDRPIGETFYNSLYHSALGQADNLEEAERLYNLAIREYALSHHLSRNDDPYLGEGEVELPPTAEGEGGPVMELTHMLGHHSLDPGEARQFEPAESDEEMQQQTGDVLSSLRDSHEGDDRYALPEGIPEFAGEMFYRSEDMEDLSPAERAYKALRS